MASLLLEKNRQKKLVYRGLLVIIMVVMEVCALVTPLAGQRFSKLPRSATKVTVRWRPQAASLEKRQRQQQELRPLSSTTLPTDRFHRQASNRTEADTPCILTIDGRRYNMTAWANAHPGGPTILQKFHLRDASKAFAAVHHSAEAYQLLPRFLVVEDEDNARNVYPVSVDSVTVAASPALDARGFQKIRRKLFTKEDPVGVHKYLGIFCLLNFIRMYYQMYFGDPAAGLATRGHPWFSLACLVPHGLLSVSSLIFQTVPKERVVGKPTIWQEFRAHNIIFGIRSVVTAMAAALAVRARNVKLARRLAVVFSGVCVLAANVAADRATQKLRVVPVESTTATMPYWEGCSLATQMRFKSFTPIVNSWQH